MMTSGALCIACQVGKAGPEPHEEGQQGPLKDGAHADSDACGTCPATQPPSPVPHDVPGSSSSEAARSGAGEARACSLQP